MTNPQTTIPVVGVSRAEYLSLENLHTCLIEEASEVAKVISKARRFGMEDYPADKLDAITNRVKLAKELGDLYAVLDLLQREYCPNLCDITEIMRNQKEERIKLNYGVIFRD